MNRQIDRWRRDLTRRPDRARTAASALAQDASAPALRALLDAVLRGDDPLAREGALFALRRLADWRCVNTVCAAWAATRHPDLAAVIVERGWVASAPPALRVLSALAAGRTELLEHGRASVVAPLLRACEDRDATIAGRARATLIRLQRPEAREALCRIAVERDSSVAREAAVVAGFAPCDQRERALFLFVTSQWAAYRALDPDGALLGAAYASAPPVARARVAAQAGRARFVGWAAAAARARPLRRPADLTEAEWDVAVAAVAGRPEDAWALAQAAPARWAAALVRRLAEAGWSPEGHARRTDFADLCRLASRCDARQPPRPLAAAPAHARPVTRLAVSPDGGLLASASADGTLRLWRLPNLAPLADLPRHPWPVVDLAFSPDSRLLVSASTVGALRLWRLPARPGDAAVCHELAGRAPALFTPDGQLLVTGGPAGGLLLWRLPDARPAAALADGAGRVGPAALSPDGALLAALVGRRSAEGARVRLWRLPDGAPQESLGGVGPLDRLLFSPDGRTLAAAGAAVRLWSLREGMASSAPGGAPLAFAPDGRLLAAGTADGGVRLLHVPDGAAAGALGGAAAADLRALGSRAVAAAGSDGSLRVWLLPSGRQLAEVPAGAPLTCLAAGPDGQILAAGGADGGLRLLAPGVEDLCRVPPADLTPADLARARRLIADPAERPWLELILALAARPRGRGDASRRIDVGAFDMQL